MNIKKLICPMKTNMAKVLGFSCIFLFCFLFSCVKVNALNIDILSSTYTGNGNDNSAVTINGVKYIQGTGVSHKDGVTFKLTDIYDSLDDLTSIAVWESAFSESSNNADYDRWYLRSVLCDSEEVCGDKWTAAVNTNRLVKYLNGDNAGEIITKDVPTGGTVTRYYIERSASNIMSQSGYVTTVVDFDKFFDSTEEVTYTYRIRNSNYLNRADKDGFGYKRIYVSLWKANNNGGEVNSSENAVLFGLAKAIDDVDVYTNYNKSHSSSNPITCTNDAIKDMICVDYVDTNGDPEHAGKRHHHSR